VTNLHSKLSKNIVSFMNNLQAARHFAALARARQFRPCREAVHLSQPALKSKHSGAEGRPGLSLLDRHSRGHQPKPCLANWCSNHAGQTPVGGQPPLKNAVSHWVIWKQANCLLVAASARSAGAQQWGKLAQGRTRACDPSLQIDQLARASHAAALTLIWSCFVQTFGDP